MNNNSPKLPSSWVYIEFGNVTDINPRLPLSDQLLGELEVQFLPMKLVEENNGKIHLTDVKRYKDVKKGYTPFKDNDVIFAKVTPCMENGKIASVSNLKNGIGFGSSEFHIIRPGKALISKYIFFYMVQQKFRHEAESSMTGAVGLRRVPKQFIEAAEIPLPLPNNNASFPKSKNSSVNWIKESKT
ncbi:restriction endonuclease subunit S [Leptospira santarosai]|uniref:restriction endonuclease subunit S n=1 Tax=Leptospira santarosai TaxID=28183 RepID=UPI0006ACEF30|nr:restriction endonuclease subunit S [Leptospira santarosai]